MDDLNLVKTLARLESLSDDGLKAFLEYSDDLILKKFARKIQVNRLKIGVERFKKPVQDNYEKLLNEINIDI